jgi:CDP-diacylglycerol--glycerol-3-phosphate 3-phosphatidyltransferase
VSGALVSPGVRARIRSIATPIAVGFGRLGLSPNHLTLIGFAVTVAGAILVSQQQWLAGGIVVFVGGVFDLFDGALARATNTVSRLGAFTDSVFDKAGEIAVYIGLVVGFSFTGFREGPILAAAAMGAALMVSYTRAKSESLGFTRGSGMASVGIMPREVRLVLLAIGLILAPVPIFEAVPSNAACAGPCDFPQGGLLSIVLAAIAIGGAITAIQRIVHVIRQPSQEEHQT